MLRQSSAQLVRSMSTSQRHHPVGTKTRIELAVNELTPGYKSLHARLNSMLKQGVAAAIISPSLSIVWMLMTEQVLLDSPVAVALLGVGGLIAGERIAQIMRVKNYAKLSVLTSVTGPSTSIEINNEIQNVIAGLEPDINFNFQGLKIEGSIGDMDYPSDAKKDALASIDSMQRVVLPLCTLTPEALKLVDQTHDRWIARLAFPFAILNLISIALKDPKDRRVDDYVVFASSAYNAYDYLSGPSVATARQNLTDKLIACKTPQDVLKVLVENQILDNGGMSFLNQWVKKQESIGVRVGRTGSPILYKNLNSSYGGPYPLHLFPKMQPMIEKTEKLSELKM